MVESPRDAGTRTRTGTALLAVAGGGALAGAVDAVESYGFVHYLPSTWALVGLSYLLVGIIVAAPTLFTRSVSVTVPIVATLLAVPAFFLGDLSYVALSSFWTHVSFDFTDYLRSYAEFQKPYTVRLELLAPLGAGLLAGLRHRSLRAAARPRGRHAAATRALASAVPPPRSAAAPGRAGSARAGSGHQVPLRLHHADVD